MKGIILAGGSGSRLFPATLAVCKQLLPIYDKPMIYYPLALFMQAGIREILIISTEEDVPRFRKLFQDGSHLGLAIEYEVQEKPRGLADAFIVGESFIQNDPVALILGDNIFYGHHLEESLQKALTLKTGGHIFGYHVQDPKRYGVLEFDEAMRPIGIEEKPEHPKSSYAVVGLYFYGPEVVSIAKSLKPSNRGELEITDVNRVYLERGDLEVTLFGQGLAWLDTGTFDAFQKASQFVQVIQERQGVHIAAIEEIAYRKGYISSEELDFLAERYPNKYGSYLKQCIPK